MSERYEITYTDATTGQAKVHTYSGNDHGAQGWAETLSRDNGGCPAVVDRVNDYTGERKTVGGVGRRE
jgi:hypothetical protein